MVIIPIIIGYVIIAAFTFFFVNYMLISSLSDEEFYEIMEDNSSRLLALLIVSVFWPICIPIIILNNIFNKGER